LVRVEGHHGDTGGEGAQTIAIIPKIHSFPLLMITLDHGEIPCPIIPEKTFFHPFSGVPADKNGPVLRQGEVVDRARASRLDDDEAGGLWAGRTGKPNSLPRDRMDGPPSHPYL